MINNFENNTIGRIIFNENVDEKTVNWYETLEPHFDRVRKTSDNIDECKLAIDAKQLCQNKKKDELKKLLKDNLMAFTTGAFSGVAAELILKFISK